MSKFDIPGVRIGTAAVHRVDQGHGKPLTLAECVEAVAHPTDGAKRVELVETIAYLAAQVVGARTNIDQEAHLAMVQVERAVSEWRRRGQSGDAA